MKDEVLTSCESYGTFLLTDSEMEDKGKKQSLAKLRHMKEKSLSFN